MPTSTSNQLIFLCPSQAALNSGKPLHVKPIRYDIFRSPTLQSSTQEILTISPSKKRKKRSRLLEQVVTHNQAELDLYRTKRSRLHQQHEAIAEEVTTLDTTSSSSRNRARPTYTNEHSNDGSQQSKYTPQEVSDAEPYYATSEEGDPDQTNWKIPSRIEEIGPVIQPISKAERLRMGPARVIGMTRRKVINKAPLLEAMERSILPAQKESKKQESIRPPKFNPLLEDEDRTTEEVLIGDATTMESIPPPPTHAFSLSNLTPISTLLSSPNQFLPGYQGGSQHEGALKFNLLALVVRVGGLEDAPDWKTGGRRRMDRCEIIVKDGSECALKVVLERDCATNWATPRDEESIDNDQLSSIDSLAGESQTSSDVLLWNSFDATATQDNDTTASRTTIERRRDNRLLPLRPGDVVVLSCLYLVRPKPFKGRSSSRFTDTKALSTYAIASPSSGATMELCWRSSIQRPTDQRRNFDKCLIGFDARCRAIYQLAQSWIS